jgi:hypothetical protein
MLASWRKHLFQNQCRRQTVSVNVVDGHALGLRQQNEDEGPHEDDPGGEEEEDEGAHGAHHGEEGLRDEEGEEHVGADLTASENPAVRVSSGNVSDGMSQPSGPHDQAKIDT